MPGARGGHPWRLARSALLAALALLPLPSLPVAAHPAAAPLDEGDGATTEWNQWGGNSARTFAADVEPVRTTPAVRWSVALPGEVLAGPVCWGGVAVVCTRDRSDALLRAYSLADGRPLGIQNLGRVSGGAGLAVWQGMYLVVADGVLRGIRHQGSTFTKTWTSSEGYQSHEPAVSKGVVYLLRSGRIASLDAVTGSSRDLVGVRSDAPPVVVEERAGAAVAGVRLDSSLKYQGKYAFLSVVGSGATGFGDAMFAPIEDLYASSASFWLYRIPGGAAGPAGWFLISNRMIRGRKGGFPSMSRPDGAKDLAGGLCTITKNPTTRNGAVYGFAENGDLVWIVAEGRSGVVVEAAKLPAGARPSPAARARSVATFGNWAVDLDTSRVLWSLPELDLQGASIPVADRTLLALSRDGKLLCLSDAGAGAAASGAAVGTTATAPGPVAPALPAAAPSGKDGLLLADGREFEGRVEILPEGRARVSPAAGGEAVEAVLAEVLCAQAGGKVLHRGRESDAVARWRAHLRPAAVRALEDVYGILLKENLLLACNEVILEARAWGLTEEHAGRLSRALTGRQESKFGDQRRKAVQPAVEAKRRAVRDLHLRASEWCTARGFPVSASCLLGDAEALLPSGEELETRGLALLPAGFPWKEAKGRGRLWIEWARELAAADAEFVAPGDAVRQREKSGFWKDGGGALVFRTPNVIFRTRCHDPRVVGRCLRNAEWTVRALTALLDPGTILPMNGDGERMDVRLHQTRDDYLRDGTQDTGYPMPWMGGHFSPRQGVSRFYVPGAGEGDPLGRDLFSVLAHELTHHFVEMRWRGGGGGKGMRTEIRGYWCIEGLARFVEDQVMEMDRRGLRWDDRTVPSLDTTKQSSVKGVMFAPTRLLDLSKVEFHGLPTEAFLKVTLRNTLGARNVSPLHLFYEQSGTMVYFMVNHRGREGRLALLTYLATYYSGTDPGPGWKALEFSTPEECDAAFREFLKGLE